MLNMVYMVMPGFRRWATVSSRDRSRPRERQEGREVTEIGRPAYQQVADDLRERITAGEFPVGSPIPSTAQLAAAHQVSVTVVRAAVAQLRNAGLLVGQPGKGVFVTATPEAAAERAATIEGLLAQVAELRAELRRAESARQDELAELRRESGALRRHLAGLYAQLGRAYPGDEPVS
jgi:DNA-binding GntR family transcriptional regulator